MSLSERPWLTTRYSGLFDSSCLKQLNPFLRQLKYALSIGPEQGVRMRLWPAGSSRFPNATTTKLCIPDTTTTSSSSATRTPYIHTSPPHKRTYTNTNNTDNDDTVSDTDDDNSLAMIIIQSNGAPSALNLYIDLFYFLNLFLRHFAQITWSMTGFGTLPVYLLFTICGNSWSERRTLHDLKIID